MSITAEVIAVGDAFRNGLQTQNESVNLKGNKLPYAPDFTFTGGFEITSPFGLGVNLSATYVGEQLQMN